MSIDLNICVYPATGDFSAVETFHGLVEAITSWNHTDGAWSVFDVGKGWIHEKHSRAKGPLTTDEILRLASECELEKRRLFSAHIPIRCWRNHSGKADLDYAILDVKTWDSDCPKLRYGDLEIEGCGQVSINPASPFRALVDEGSVEDGKNYNERVADNLDVLGELLVIIADTVGPRSVKLFVDEGLKLPHNSHCTYFRDAEAVIADLNLIERVWSHGLHAYGETPPLRDYDDRKHDFAFNRLRTVEQRRSLWEDLRRRLPALAQVTPEVVENTLQATTLDVQELNDGFFLFDYPYFFNSFVAPFYLDVLDHAAT